MHFHLPKPLHGWREFAGEVGIIVVGVLIALGAEQIVEKIHEHILADESRAQINQELATDFAVLGNRTRSESCIARRRRFLRASECRFAQHGLSRAN